MCTLVLGQEKEELYLRSQWCIWSFIGEPGGGQWEPEGLKQGADFFWGQQNSPSTILAMVLVHFLDYSLI